MTLPTVLVTRRWPAPCEDRLREHFAVTLNPDNQPLTASELKAALQQYDAVLPTVTDRLTAEVLNVTPLRCRLLGNFGVGYNHIDLAAAKARGLTVTNTPDVLTDATADIALLLMLMAARRAGEGERLVRAGLWTGWHPTQHLGTQVTGKTLGLIGFGRIGQAVAARARLGFGMRIVYYTPRPADPEVIRRLDARPLDSSMLFCERPTLSRCTVRGARRTVI